MSKADIATYSAYGSSGSLTVYGFAVGDIGALVGIVLGVGTFLVTLHYKRKEREDRLAHYRELAEKAQGEPHEPSIGDTHAD